MILKFYLTIFSFILSLGWCYAQKNTASSSVNWRDKYSDVGEPHEGLSKVSYGDYMGFVDETGKLIIPLIYNDVKDFSDGLALVSIGGIGAQNFSYIDKTGKEIISALRYDEARSFTEGLAAVRIIYQWGYINRSGEVVIPMMFHLAEPFIDGKAKVKLNDKYFYINKDRECVKDCDQAPIYYPKLK
ncbi:MAG: WG repeat-containing protein [Chitinophagales bacterium]|nr:WG repeat-containing protein [Chitinophagales bacterium]MCZ2393583.1 WG repeat-containing protein [Chitinophagales bacterium]